MPRIGSFLCFHSAAVCKRNPSEGASAITVLRFTLLLLAIRCVSARESVGRVSSRDGVFTLAPVAGTCAGDSAAALRLSVGANRTSARQIVGIVHRGWSLRTFVANRDRQVGFRLKCFFPTPSARRGEGECGVHHVG